MTKKYKCPTCGEVTHWTIEDYAAKGEPVCINDGDDMELI